MVDVGDKPVTARRAVAAGRLRMSTAAFAEAVEKGSRKGDAQAVARVAGIQAAKRTPELIPLCHGVPLTSVSVDIRSAPDLPGFEVRATALAEARTGVEMEALSAVSVALLTLYDMFKSLGKGMVIESVELLEKTGGTSGDHHAPGMTGIGPGGER